MSNETLHQLARRAGLLVDWVDAADMPQRVSDNSLRRILSALDFPCATEAEAARSLQQLSAEIARRGLMTGEVDVPVVLPGVRENRARLVLEDGTRQDVRLDATTSSMTLLVPQPGYHKLEFGDRTIKLAVAPSAA